MKIWNRRSGQIMLEYGIMFVIILLVMVYAATSLLKPSMRNLYSNTSGVIDKASNLLENNPN